MQVSRLFESADALVNLNGSTQLFESTLASRYVFTLKLIPSRARLSWFKVIARQSTYSKLTRIISPMAKTSGAGLKCPLNPVQLSANAQAHCYILVDT